MTKAAQPQAQRAVSVVELFTSQGCSSCPTADAVLHSYAQRPDIVALSLSVDYWDYLGWKDTLANPKFTTRQRAYADERGDGRVYTPQVVVNGLVHVIGSSRTEIDRAIAETSQRLTADRIEVVARSDGKTVTIEAGAIPQTSGMTGGTIWLAVVMPSVDVEIRRGENRGRTVTYANVVRDLTPIGMWSGKPTHIELPETAVLQQGQRGAVLLQEGTAGAIVGAAWITGPEH
ncbi:MAG: DUF1223 domain-containing protein [Hyphomicrobiaceae bacterium]|nr:DUF1223 domain-containing protein [Hyphomicrobiaceae bacterium]